MAHVPSDEHGRPRWFTEIAQQSQGDRLLAVLKADADSLGARFHGLLHSTGLAAMVSFSDQVDAFFASRLGQELADNREGRWAWIYTVFAGGDDLVMVGPWDVMFDFAGRMNELFAEEFRSHALTLSAGLALGKPKRPIKVAVAEAERLLDEAKAGTKNQIAAFGQVWNWGNHAAISTRAKELAAWVRSSEMERGWLHTLLALAEGRHGRMRDPLATARLAYHVTRNYRRGTRARRWADSLLQRFDDSEDIEVRYLPTIVRYALTATRAPHEED
jgi:CRISPR-associated protein Csm1